MGKAREMTQYFQHHHRRLLTSPKGEGVGMVSGGQKERADVANDRTSALPLVMPRK